MTKTEMQIREHWDEANSIYPSDRIVGVFCQGSQNYNLGDENSDMDTKCLVCPSIEDFYIGKEMGRGNFTHYRENQEHIVFTDVRGFLGHLKSGSPNFVELLFSKAFVVNPMYQDLWDKLTARREEIARYNEQMAVKSMNRMIQSKSGNLQAKKTYPTRMYILEDLDYDPKELSHEIRVYYLLKDFVEGKPFADCLLGIKDTEGETLAGRQLIMDLKRKPLYDYKGAVAVGKEYAARANELQANFMKEKPYWYGNEELAKYMEDIIREMMERSVKKELK